MVIKRTIASLKKRPDDERRGLAVLISAIFMFILLAAWGTFFFRNVQNSSADASYQNTADANTAYQNLAASASSTAEIIKSVTQALSQTNLNQPSGGATLQPDVSQTTTVDNTASESAAPAVPASTGNAASELQAALAH